MNRFERRIFGLRLKTQIGLVKKIDKVQQHSLCIIDSKLDSSEQMLVDIESSCDLVSFKSRLIINDAYFLY